MEFWFVGCGRWVGLLEADLVCARVLGGRLEVTHLYVQRGGRQLRRRASYGVLALLFDIVMPHLQLYFAS